MKEFLKINWFKIILSACALGITISYITQHPSNQMRVVVENDKGFLGHNAFNINVE